MGETLPFLRNSYWILRHGKSIPNDNGLIVSSMANGTLEEFGLAPEGIQQAKLAGELLDKELKARNIPIETVRICFSPFSRTTHTAKIVADVLGISFKSCQCKVMTELRERFFGPLFELLSHDKMQHPTCQPWRSYPDFPNNSPCSKRQNIFRSRYFFKNKASYDSFNLIPASKVCLAYSRTSTNQIIFE